MSDGVLITRLFAFVVVGWPFVAVALVYLVRRSRISSAGKYFAKALAVGYGLSLLGPFAMLALFFLFGLVAEVATLYTIFFGLPIFAVLPVVVAVRFARDVPDGP
jgi:hypothetical protein